jgi:hypothetical protein
VSRAAGASAPGLATALGTAARGAAR